MPVKVYSTPVCPYCATIKDWLKKNEIDFEDIDVSLDEDARQLLIDKTDQMGVPVVEINGEFIVGFDKDKFSKLLNIK